VRWQAAEGRYRNGTLSLDRAQLLDWLAEAGTGADWLLQPALCNHPELAGLAPDGLVTVRLMTAHQPSVKNR
jgi:hypothetical protein